MLRLVYVSAANTDLTNHDLQSILTASRLNNAREGLSGILLYGNGCFAQTLEGAKDTLLNRYERIRRDPRHNGLIEILHRPAEKPAFKDWTMGYAALEPFNQDHAGFINLAKQALAGALPDDAPREICAFMESFYKNNIEFKDRVRRAGVIV